MDVFTAESKLDLAAGAAGILSFFPPPGETWKVLSFTLMPDATITADAANYITARPYKGHGTGTPLAAARSTVTVTGSTMTAGTKVLWGKSGSSPTPDIAWTTPNGLDMEITDVSAFTCQIAHAGAGAAAKLTGKLVAERIRTVAS